MTEQRHGSEERPKPEQPNNHPASGGEDESSTEKEGDDSHLHEDQKTKPM